MEKSGPFYLQPIVNPLINIWYKKTPMGINSINSILMIMATRCSKNNCPILLTTISWLHPKINISSLQITQYFEIHRSPFSQMTINFIKTSASNPFSFNNCTVHVHMNNQVQNISPSVDNSRKHRRITYSSDSSQEK